MRNEKEVQIDGITLYIRQLPAMRSMKFFREVVDTLGPALTELGNISGLADTDLSVFKPILSELMENMSEDKLERMTKILLGDALVLMDDKRVPLLENGGVFDMVFQGKVFTIFKFLRAALEYNYGDFIAGLTGKLQD